MVVPAHELRNVAAIGVYGWRFSDRELNMCKTITLGDDMHRFLHRASLPNR